jgi:hypothetical protein
VNSAIFESGETNGTNFFGSDIEFSSAGDRVKFEGEVISPELKRKAGSFHLAGAKVAIRHEIIN